VRSRTNGVASFAVVLLLAVSGGGCTQACTEVGGTNGVAVSIPTALYLQTGNVSIEVCDDTDCATTVKEFGKLPGNAGPEERFFTATFSDLGSEFEPGSVEVRVELRDNRESLMAVRESNVEVQRSYPNRRVCDGDGYVSGSLRLEPDDAT